jgi:hypothetical protein
VKCPSTGVPSPAGSGALDGAYMRAFRAGSPSSRAEKGPWRRFFEDGWLGAARHGGKNGLQRSFELGVQLLERAADQARDRGGHAAETALTARFSEFTPDPHIGARRSRGPRAAVSAGDLRHVPAMLDRAEPG